MAVSEVHVTSKFNTLQI